MSEEKNKVSFWDMAMEKIQSCKQESDKFFHIGKVKLDKTFLHKEKQELYMTLGKKTLELVESKKIKNAELKELCAKITDINTQIDSKEDKLKDITDSNINIEEADIT